MNARRGTKAMACRNRDGDDRMHPSAGVSRRYDAQDQNIVIIRVAADFMLNLIAYNLIRIPKLVAA